MAMTERAFHISTSILILECIVASAYGVLAIGFLLLGFACGIPIFVRLLLPYQDA